MRGDLLLSEFFSTPWAMRPESILALGFSVKEAILNGGRLRAESNVDSPPVSVFAARVESLRQASAGSAIQVLPCYGAIVQRSGMMTEWCGGTSTQQLSQALINAGNDPNISQIMIDFDTPGGSVYGVQEAGDVIRAVAAKKPVIGIANSVSASAGYWLMSQCSEAYCTPGGEVGSIGVYTAHQNNAGALELAGIGVELIQAGEFKTEGNPFGPLSEEARANIQAMVNRYYGAFTAAVAKGRGASVATVREDMGRGRMLSPADAVKAGMIDGISTFDDLLAKMARSKGKAGANNAGRAARERFLNMY